ncbi:MAG: hypothetical protein KF819_33110 [Labilithrix sp.]|nr:hypothetical protein [Labilithrix sp.]
MAPYATYPQQPFAPPQTPQTQQPFGAPPSSYTPPAPSSYTPPPPPAYGAPYAQPTHGQPTYGQPTYGQPTYGTPVPPPPHAASPHAASPHGAPQHYAQPRPTPVPTHLPGLGSFTMPKSITSMPQPSGLPAPLAFGLALVAVVVALIFDVVFLKVHIPGVGSYAWYLTTALSFAGAGWGSATWTRASKMTAMTAMTIAAILYGAADLGLGFVLEGLSLSGAIMLGAQGLAIACVCGFGAIYKGFAAKGD